jgi:hypothetical protein
MASPGRCALLVRGITHRHGYVHFSNTVYDVDFRTTAPGVLGRVVEPLRAALAAEGGVLDVFVASYASPLSGAVLSAFAPVRSSAFLPAGSAQQARLLRAGLDLVRAAQEADGAPYDRVVVTRFDLLLHDGVDPVALLLRRPLDDRRFYFVWREAAQSVEPCVGDALHSLTGSQVGAFAAAVSGSRVQTSMHYVHDAVRAALSEGDAIGFMVPDGRHASNTDDAPNPLYALARGAARRGRPRHNANFYRRFHCLPRF